MKFKHKITEIYVSIDDFCKKFEENIQKNLLSSGSNVRNRKVKMSPAEVMTILILFHLEGSRTLKYFYNHMVKKYLAHEFPDTVSYNRFVELSQMVIFPMTLYLKEVAMGECSGISFIDSTALMVCHNRRINGHKTFKQYAERGHCSVGFFYGFKLHLIINDRGEILNFMLTKANVDDRVPLKSVEWIKQLWGKLFGDRGYISQGLFDALFMDGVHLITKIKKNMKNIPMDMKDKILLRKRAVIECVNDALKNICQIEHTRHRSFANFLSNMIAALIAYSFLPKKPSIKCEFIESNQLAIW